MLSDARHVKIIISSRHLVISYDDIFNAGIRRTSPKSLICFSIFGFFCVLPLYKAGFYTTGKEHFVLFTLYSARKLVSFANYLVFLLELFNKKMTDFN